MQEFRKSTIISVPASLLEQWHHAPGAFQRLTPPWERVRVLEEPEEIADGTRAVLSMKAGPFWTRWVAEHRECHSGQGFTDLQIEGPFAEWRHEHRFEAKSDSVSELMDAVHYQLPMGALGNLLAGWFIRRKLAHTFRYRHAVTSMDLLRMGTEPRGDGLPMTVLVTGATGMVGTALEAFLRMRGHEVRRVTRSPRRPGDVRWDVDAGIVDLDPDAKIDAVVHLAGENVAGGRWTEAQRCRIMESRRKGTRLLCESLASLKVRPRVLVSASGVNYYAQGGEENQDETAARGNSFLSEVCQVWEGETDVAKQAGIRVVNLRLGVILSPAGGALSKMLPAFQFGVAGRLGSGRQRMAWIALDDVVDIMHRALRDERYVGPVNVVAPETPTNAEFTQALARALGGPAVIPVPALALRLALGKELADETLLADLAIAPGVLRDLGYSFRYPNVQSALGFLLGKE